MTGEAQQTGKVYRIGFISLQPRSASAAPQYLPDALRPLGWSEGQNIMIDWRWADGRPERLDDLARDLVRSNVDLIVAWSNEAIAVARRATRTIPIVMAGGALPVEAGFVASLARPGGNVTGTTYNPPARRRCTS